MYRVLTENAHYISRDTAFSGNTRNCDVCPFYVIFGCKN